MFRFLVLLALLGLASCQLIWRPEQRSDDDQELRPNPLFDVYRSPYPSHERHSGFPRQYQPRVSTTTLQPSSDPVESDGFESSIYALPSFQRHQALLRTPENGHHKPTFGLKNPFLLSQAEAETIAVPEPYLSSYRKTTEPTTSQKPNLYVVPPISLPYQSPSFMPVVFYGQMPHSTSRHVQDSRGQYGYSYTTDTSAKSESRSLDGTTKGGYSYVDANGKLQVVRYIADHNGFRVQASNLPSGYA